MYPHQNQNYRPNFSEVGEGLPARTWGRRNLGSARWFRFDPIRAPAPSSIDVGRQCEKSIPNPEIVLSLRFGGMALESYWVYILRCSDGSLYTGYTSDLVRRLRAHQAGSASRYTRSRLPVTLAHTEKAASRGGALRREAQIKKLTRREKISLCRAYEATQKQSIP